MVRSLKSEGVELIFSLTGHSIDLIYDACIDEGIRIIDCRHEQAAAHMADAWTRITGRPGVVVVTDQPGVVAMVAGMRNAERSPVIAIAGKSSFSDLDTGAHTEMDQLDLVRPLVKWGRTVYETRRIPEYISMAFRHALAGRPGPAYLDIPLDVMEKSVDEDKALYPKNHRTENRPQGDPKAIQKAVELLLEAKRPLVIAGSGVWWAQAGGELRELVEMAGLPFILRPKARGCVPEDHPLFVGPASAGTKRADVVLAVGIRFDGLSGLGQASRFDEKVRIIQIDIEGSTIGQNRPIEVGIIGDARLVLRQMAEKARDKTGWSKEPAWVGECRTEYQKWRERVEAAAASNTVPIHPARLWAEVRGFLDREAIVAVDGGLTGTYCRRVFNAYYPGRLLDHGPHAQLGSSIPFGIAAKLARPQNQVLICLGDGAFGISGMEFDTAVRHHVPVVAVIANNGCWGVCYHRQKRLFGREVGVQLGFTRYDRVVEALGGYGEWVEKPEDIRPALQRAFASGIPACVNVKIDPDYGPAELIMAFGGEH